MDKKNKSRVPGVIFDFDGTLADTVEDITASINVCFEQSGLAPVSNRRIRSLIGWGLRNLFAKASGIDEPAKIDALVNAYRPIYAERMLLHTRLYAGIDALLAHMTAERVPMCSSRLYCLLSYGCWCWPYSRPGPGRRFAPWSI